MLAIGAIALAGVGYFTDQQLKKNVAVEAAAPDPEELANRKQLGDFILTDADGKQQKLSDFRGNVVLLSFWASWCTPCLVELPTFAELEEKFGQRGLRIVTINIDEGESTVDGTPSGKAFARDFWAKKKFRFASFFDSQKAVAQQFGVDRLPSNFVIDRQGRIAFSAFGVNDWTGPQSLETLESLLAESP